MWGGVRSDGMSGRDGVWYGFPVSEEAEPSPGARSLPWDMLHGAVLLCSSLRWGLIQCQGLMPGTLGLSELKMCCFVRMEAKFTRIQRQQDGMACDLLGHWEVCLWEHFVSGLHLGGVPDSDACQACKGCSVLHFPHDIHRFLLLHARASPLWMSVYARVCQPCPWRFLDNQ